MLLTYWLTDWTARLGLKYQPLNRRRRQKLTVSEQVERCEDRALLSAISVVDDTATIEGRTVAIIFDVLKNDSTTAGGELHITGLDQPTYGHVQIIPGDPTATGAAARDRISYVGAPQYVGTDLFRYEATDQDLNVDDAWVTLQVLTAPGAFEIGEAANGQQQMNGGLGGHGYEADPTIGFDPSIEGDFEYEITQTGPWDLPIGLGSDTTVSGTGDQTMTQTVTVSSDGSGNGTYHEVVTWTYGLGAGDVTAAPGTPGSDQNTIWGLMSYSLDVTTTNGTTVTTFSFNSTDNFDSTSSTTVTETASGAYFTDHSWGSYTYSMTISHTDFADGSEAGSQTATSSRSSGFLRLGTYSYALTGGGVSGSYSTSINDSEFSFYHIAWADDPTFGWNGIGTSSDTGTGSTSSNYSGSGSYGDANFAGTVIEGGGQSSHYNYSTTGIFNANGWLTLGTGSAGGNQNDGRSYSGTGTYSRNEEGVTKGGTTVANGHNNSQSNYNVTYGLSGGTWDVLTSSSIGSGDSDDFTSYSGSGTYVTLLVGGTINGTLNEDGHTHSFDNFTTSGSIGGDGAWATNGSGSGGTDGHTHSDFDGSGSHNLTTTSQDGNLTQSMSGTVTESGHNDSAYNSSVNWGLGANGWELMSGSGTESSTDHVESQSQGSGSYTRTVPLTPQGYDATVTGPRSESASFVRDNSSSASSDVVNGAWVRTSGSGSGTTVEVNSSEYSGSGTYHSIGAFNAPITGDIQEHGGETSQTDSSTFSTWTNGDWVTTGTSTATGANNGTSSYSGVGNYGWTDLPSSGGGTTSMSGTAEESGGEDSVGGFTLYSALDSSGSWVPSSGSSSGSGNSRAMAKYSGSGSYSKSGSDLQFGAWSINGDSTSFGQQSQNSSYSTASTFQNGGWVIDQGTSSASGASNATATYSGTGTYAYNDGEIDVTNDITQNGTETQANQWSTESTAAAGTPTSSSGTGWTTNGSGSGNDSSNNTINFTTASGTFILPVYGGAVTGDFTDYFHRTNSGNSNYEITLGADGAWALSSGSGSNNYGEGFGTHASGSGSLAWSGDYVANGVVTGGYDFSGTGIYTQDETNSDGSFADFEVQNGEWALTNSGASASGDFSETYDWFGSGSYTQYAVSGSFTQGGGNGQTIHTEVSEGFASSASGSGYVEGTDYYNRSYLGSATLTLLGATGPYSQWGGESRDWSSHIDLEWQDVAFVATNGSATNVAMTNVGQKFNGFGQSSGSGMSGTVIYKFANNDYYLENQGYDYSPSTDTWTLTSGDGIGSGTDSLTYKVDSTEDYTTEEYNIAGTKTNGSWDGYDIWWDYTTLFAGGGSGSGAWTSSGSGSGLGAVGKRSGYSASGAISQGSITGTYDEGGDTYENFEYELRLQLSNGVWSTGGSGSGMGNGGSHETLHLEDSNWSVSGHGSGAAVGSSTLDRGESFGYGYGYDANLTSVEQGWIVTGGSGSGDGSASYLYDASGVGTYSASFDEGAGTVSGTVSAARHDGWEYSYHQDYNFDTVAYAWTTTESGSGTADGTSHTDYSGSGSYSTSSSSATLSSSASGGVEESGQTDETYDATFSWTDNDWTLTEHTGGATLDDYHYSGGSWSKTSTSSGDFAGGNGSWNDMETSATHDKVTHHESAYSGTETETHTGGVATWSKSHSGSNSGYTETTDGSGYSASWGTATNDGYTARTETGYSAASGTAYDRREDTYSWSNASADDGSASESWSSGGNHQWATTNDMEWDIQWTETTTYGGSSGGSGSGSGSSSGGSSSYTTSGGSSGSSHWSSSGSDSWSMSWSQSTPPLSSGSGSSSGYSSGTSDSGSGASYSNLSGDSTQTTSDGSSQTNDLQGDSTAQGGGSILGTAGEILSGAWSLTTTVTGAVGDGVRWGGHQISVGVQWVGDGAADLTTYAFGLNAFTENLSNNIAGAGGALGGLVDGLFGLGASIIDLPGTLGAMHESGMAYANNDNTGHLGPFAYASGALGGMSLLEGIVGIDFLTNDSLNLDERGDRFMAGASGMLGVASAVGLVTEGVMTRSNLGNKALLAQELKKNGQILNCFVAGTKVATENGSQAIETIEQNQKVWAYDLIASEWKLRRVIEAFRHPEESVFVSLSVNGESIESTWHHPYWVIDGDGLYDRPKCEHVDDVIPYGIQGRWVDAGQLRIGDSLRLRTGLDGVVTARTTAYRSTIVFNLHIDDLHCYAVGENGILVHNNGGTSVKPQTEVGTSGDIHRIGGGSVENLRLKPAEAKLDPPGISVLKGESAASAAEQMKAAFPNAAKLQEMAKTVGSATEEAIRGTGFDVMPDPTKKFPNHHRIIHPDGVAGFIDENLALLSQVFKNLSPGE